MTALPEQLRSHGNSPSVSEVLEMVARTAEMVQRYKDTADIPTTALDEIDRLAVDLSALDPAHLRSLIQHVTWLEQRQQARAQADLDTLNGADAGGEVRL